MTAPPIDRSEQLQKFISQGITKKTDLAKKLGVSRPTLDAEIKRLSKAGMDVLALAPVVAARPNPKEVARKRTDRAKQAKERRQIRDGARRFAKLIDRQVNIIDQLNQINKTARQALARVETAAKSDTKLLSVVFKGCAEVRSQLEFAAELVKMLYDAQAVQEFQEEVLAVIGSVDVDVRREIERRLAERRALRGSTALPGAFGVEPGGDDTGGDSPFNG